MRYQGLALALTLATLHIHRLVSCPGMDTLRALGPFSFEVRILILFLPNWAILPITGVLSCREVAREVHKDFLIPKSKEDTPRSTCVRYVY